MKEKNREEGRKTEMRGDRQRGGERKDWMRERRNDKEGDRKTEWRKEIQVVVKNGREKDRRTKKMDRL